MKQKPVAISRIADYASDPEGFEKRAGGPRSKKAAAAGDRRHRSVVDTRLPIWLVPGIALFLVVVAYLLFGG